MLELIMSAHSNHSGVNLAGSPGVEVFLCSGDQVQFTVSGGSGTIYYCFRYAIWDQIDGNVDTPVLYPAGPVWQPPPYPAGFTDPSNVISPDPSIYGTITQSGLYTAPAFTDSQIPWDKLLYVINYSPTTPDNGAYTASLIRCIPSGDPNRF